MRRVVLDTETTGMNVAQGHRVIEIGCIELLDREITARNFHCYLNPGRNIDPGAEAVHGISAEFLADKPSFGRVAAEFLEFIRGAELLIHNAEFDRAFLDHELRLLGTERGCLMDHASVVDTLALARELHPGQKNSLDALCKRYEVDNSCRDLHGALLDAQLLAQVYLAMTAGQVGFHFALEREHGEPGQREAMRGPRPPIRVLKADLEDLEAHRGRVATISAVAGRCLWSEV